MGNSGDSGPVQSVDRAVAILEILARDGEAGVSEVARELGVHKSTASRLFAALARSESGARVVESALAEVFPWARHLSAAERSEFAVELIDALSDAAELTIDRIPHEVTTEWRAAARIKADKSEYLQALAPTEGDFGPPRFPRKHC